MSDIKRRVELYSFYDRTGLEAHLARMAERGWLLEKIGTFTWHYRRIEPKTLTFSVTYFPKASAFDPAPSEGQQVFYEFCAHTGWTLAAAQAQMQVFYNERPNPVPIETDPAEEVDTIHRTMKRSFLPAQLALLAAALLNGGLLIFNSCNNPIEMLANPASLLAAGGWVLVLLLVGVECGGYFRWHSEAVRAAARGEYLETRSHRKLQIASLAVLAAWLLCYFVSIAASGNRMLIAVSALMFLPYVLGLFLVMNGVKGFLKRKKVSAKANFWVTLAAVLVMAFLLVGIILFVVLSGSRHGWLRDDTTEEETYEYNGRTYTIGRDQLPLTLDDLLEGDFDRYSRERWGSQSLLLGRYVLHQWPLGPVELFPESVHLDYEIILVKAPFLYGLCREAKLHERDDWGAGGPEDTWYGYAYAPVDPAPWGAEEAYCWTRGDKPGNQFLLFYTDRVVEISLDWDGEPTLEQMAVVGEKLGGWAGP